MVNEKMAKPTYVVFAAGKGTRLWPSTADDQKCMLRVMEKPLLEWTIDEIGKSAGKIVVIVGEKKDSLVKHFDTSMLVHCAT